MLEEVVSKAITGEADKIAAEEVAKTSDEIAEKALARWPLAMVKLVVGETLATALRNTLVELVKSALDYLHLAGSLGSLILTVLVIILAWELGKELVKLVIVYIKYARKAHADKSSDKSSDKPSDK